MLYTVRITTEASFAPLIEAGLPLIGVEMSSWQHADSGATCFESYHEIRTDAERLAGQLNGQLQEWAEGERWAVEVAELPEAAWREAWKHFFRTEQVSPNIVVRPPWEPLASTARCVIELNPGLSFGTGRHFTTRSCLQLLDRLAGEWPGATLLDAGCGSGILAIAAVKLGFQRVTAFDNDPQAVAVAVENAAINGAVDRVLLSVKGVEAFVPAAPFDVVVANLYDALLCAHAPVLTGFLAPGPRSRLVLSGMLGGQRAAVQAAYAVCGWEPETVLQDAEWATLLLRRV